MNWKDELRKSGFSNGRDWVIEISIAESFIESLLKKQRESCGHEYEDLTKDEPSREIIIYKRIINAPEPGEE